MNSGETHGKMVSVCVPMKNEEPIIRQHLSELRDQTYKNLEIIIVDNNSSDKSRSIARQFCFEDSRFRLVENGTDIGKAQNFVEAFRHARGDYLMWAQCDDYYDAEFISRGVAILDQRPEVVSVTAPMSRFTGPSESLGPRKALALDEESPEERIATFFGIAFESNALFSCLHRRLSIMPLVEDFLSYPGDWCIVLGIAMKGKIVCTDEGDIIVGAAGGSNQPDRLLKHRNGPLGWFWPFHRGRRSTLNRASCRSVRRELRRGWRRANLQAAIVQFMDARSLARLSRLGLPPNDGDVARQRFAALNRHPK